jgi:hypothetical protein
MTAITEQDSVTPEELLAQLKAAARNARKQRNLDLIFEVCREQKQRGSSDFTIATIGRLSEARGGPKHQSIRNENGDGYRALIACWANHTGGHTKRPTKAPDELNERLLRLIPDPAVRAAVGAQLAEARKLKSENRLLQQHANLVIDMRPAGAPQLPKQPVELLPSFAGRLKPSEVAALKEAISPKLLTSHGWQAHPNGKITTEKGRLIFPPSFVTAIQKVLAECGASTAEVPALSQEYWG